MGEIINTVPFQVEIKDTWVNEKERVTVRAIRDYRGIEFLVYYDNEWQWIEADKCTPMEV